MQDPHPSKDVDKALQEVPLLVDIIERQPDSKEIWYGHSILTSTLFPANPPKEGTDFVSKSNGSYEYILEAGIDPKTRRRQFPSGKYPRLIMAWMAKQIRAAGKRKTDTVDPEHRVITIPSMYRLLDELGIPYGGHTAVKVQEQLRLLLSSHISIRRTTGFSGKTFRDTVSLPLVEAVRFAEDNKDDSLSGASFVLTEEVYRRLARESAPFDTRASRFLLSGRSVLPYDVYIWLVGSMKELRHPLTVGWDWLYDRFGDGAMSMQNFRATFRRALQKVRQVYPGVNVADSRRGLTLFPSPTAVEVKHARRQLDGEH